MRIRGTQSDGSQFTRPGQRKERTGSRKLAIMDRPSSRSWLRGYQSEAGQDLDRAKMALETVAQASLPVADARSATKLLPDSSDSLCQGGKNRQLMVADGRDEAEMKMVALRASSTGRDACATIRKSAARPGLVAFSSVSSRKQPRPNSTNPRFERLRALNKGG